MKCIGAIAGDVIGSIYEFKNIKTTEFPLFGENCRFTDDSILTIATMNAILTNTSYEKNYHEFGVKYNYEGHTPGYGGRFLEWLKADSRQPYNSYGNGSAMRVSPVAWVNNNLNNILIESSKSAEVTHNHPEGIKGANAVATTIFLARQQRSKEYIRDYIEKTFNYDLQRTCDNIRPDYVFHVSCQKSVPESIIAFLDSNNFENSIRLAISLGGDSDTIAAITGSIAEAFYGIPQEIEIETLKRIPQEFIDILYKFNELL
jgi:ADP-ribosylglycohydrolase